MSKSFFNDFNPVSTKAWKQKIQVDLKGADYNDSLIWNTNDNINVKPFYNQDDLQDAIPFTQSQNKWAICQSIYVIDAKKGNLKAIDAISRGAERISFIISEKTIAIESLLENIDLKTIAIYFQLVFLDANYLNQLKALPHHSNIFINTDIIGNLAATGNWFFNMKDDFHQLETQLNQSELKNNICINSSLYQNAGANIVQQLAYSLAHANEYLNHLDTKEQTFTFNVAVGTNYFFEIAKLRALRLLWDTLATEYNTNTNCHIIAVPSKRNKTIYSYNTNMLRTTTECMSAILGGANTVCNLPYDALYHKDNEFGERIARNQLLILKNESYFDAVTNASDGSYYIESLTTQLAEKALVLFKSIEAQGGFLSQLVPGTIQKKIKESATKEQTEFNTGELILLGSNKHPYLNDKMKADLELYPFLKTNKRKTLIEPIFEKRLAEILEQDRLKTE